MLPPEVASRMHVERVLPVITEALESAGTDLTQMDGLAVTNRPGLIGAANRSTLVLDEIGELPEVMQAHLLRVLDAGEYQRLGENEARTADVRLVALTPLAVEIQVFAHVLATDQDSFLQVQETLLLHILGQLRAPAA